MSEVRNMKSEILILELGFCKLITETDDSVHHTWIFSVLRRQMLPPSIISLVQGLLHEVKVSPVLGLPTRAWIPINRGVKQGCPLSPLLFILALDPIVREIEEGGVPVYAYADDMAFYTEKLTDIQFISKVVNTYQDCSGLFINGKKSGVLPTFSPSPSDRSFLADLNLWPAPLPSPTHPDYNILLAEWQLNNSRLLGLR